MKSLKSIILILILNTLKISWGKSILQPPIDVLHETPTSLPAPARVANNGIRIFSQGFPQYQTLTQTKTNQLPVWISPQGMISYLQGQNQQVYQVPFSSITATSGNTHSGTGLIAQGSSQGVVSSHPLTQSQLISQGILGDNISFPGTGQLLESIKLGNANAVPTANGATGYITSDGTIGPQSMLSTDGTLIQSSIRPDMSTQNNLFSSGGSLQGQGFMTSFPNQVQYPTMGYSEIFGGSAPPHHAIKWANVPNDRPLGSGFIYTSGSTNEGTDTSANNVASLLQNPGVQTQMIQVPCTLQIPSPVPISVNPGISQISTNIPMNQQASIPSSFIDNSPPTIAILRPPSSLDNMQNLNYASLPVAVSTTHLRQSSNEPYATDAKSPSFVTTTIREETKENSRSQDSAGVLVQNDDPSESKLKFASDLARNSLPRQYSTRPLYTNGASPTALTADSTSTRKQVQSPTSRPTRGKNPFFSVNKRKHFEFYSYF